MDTSEQRKKSKLGIILAGIHLCLGVITLILMILGNGGSLSFLCAGILSILGLPWIIGSYAIIGITHHLGLQPTALTIFFAHSISFASLIPNIVIIYFLGNRLGDFIIKKQIGKWFVLALLIITTVITGYYSYYKISNARGYAKCISGAGVEVHGDDARDRQYICVMEGKVYSKYKPPNERG